MSHGDEWKKERLRELGSRVRTKREQLGLTIGQVAEKTRIRSRYLIAVEEGDDSISPGQTYFRAFLKTYASFLGLDGAAMSAEYQDILAEAQAMQTGKVREAKPKPQEERRLKPEPAAKTAPAAGTAPPPATEGAPPAVSAPGTYSAPRPYAARPRRRVPGERRRKGSGAWVLLLLLIAAAAVYVVTARPAFIFGPGTAETEELTEPTGAVPSTGNGTEPPEEPAEPGDETPAEPPAPKVTREDPNEERTVWSIDQTPLELMISMRTTTDSYCWVSVRTDGRHSFDRTLAPGEVVDITAESEISIQAGRPWEMNIVLNGQEIGPGGEFGPVKVLIFRSTVTSQ